jgi:hypothetical protein
MKKTIIAGAAAVTAACLLTACSGGDSGSSVKKVEVKPPATEKVTPPSEAAGVGLKSGSTAPPGAPGAEKPK